MKHLLFAVTLLLAQACSVPAFAHSALEEVPAAAGAHPAHPKAAAPATEAQANPHAGHAMPEPDQQDGQARPTEELPPAAESDAHEEMTMLHPGLPDEWILPAGVAMLAIALWALFARQPSEKPARTANLATLPLVGPFVRFLNRSPYPLLAIKIVTVAVFVMAVVAGLFGTPYPEHNLATALVWNMWWPLVVVSVFFLGSAWCAICPWNTLSNWIVRRKLWKRANPHPGRNGKVPRWLQNVWLALLMFVGLTWLETGIGVTSIPFATALMALVMLTLSIVFLWLYERKAFCRYVCPVGRTLGYYARLAPVAVRPVDQKTCDSCKTLECYNGSKNIEPCPTHLVVGRFSQNTNCLSCGSCMLSCPHKNVSWQLRPMGSEARDQARPQWDGAWFMLLLLGITIFHGLTMMPFWRDWIAAIAGLIGETGRPYASFTLAMLGSFAAVVAAYALPVGAAWLAGRRRTPFRTLFTAYAFAALPLAFVYHLAHNLDHISRESANLFALLMNPLGIGLGPVSAMAKHNQMMSPIFPDELMYTLQAGLMVLGFWLAVQIVRHRGREQLAGGRVAAALRLLPVLGFVGAITAANLWLMAQGMEMRF